VENIINIFKPGVAYAQSVNQIELAPQGSFANLGAAGLTVPNIVSAGITWILVISALVAFLFLILGGIKWITSGGDKDSTAKAQGTITAALIGLAVVFAAWAILKLLEFFFGITIFAGGGALVLPPGTGTQ